MLLLLLLWWWWWWCSFAYLFCASKSGADGHYVLLVGRAPGECAPTGRRLHLVPWAAHSPALWWSPFPAKRKAKTTSQPRTTPADGREKKPTHLIRTRLGAATKRQRISLSPSRCHKKRCHKVTPCGRVHFVLPSFAAMAPTFGRGHWLLSLLIFSSLLLFCSVCPLVVRFREATRTNQTDARRHRKTNKQTKETTNERTRPGLDLVRTDWMPTIYLAVYWIVFFFSFYFWNSSTGRSQRLTFVNSASPFALITVERNGST